jgi:uncharacterized protein (TIGR02599 family)
MKSRDSLGFTLIELLVSTTIVILITLMLVTATTQTGALWTRTKGKMEQFREARTGFETMTQRLSQATLNTYWDYDKPTAPTRYQRRSELRFTSGQADALLGPDGDNLRVSHCVFFHAPLGFTAVQTRDGAQDSDKVGQGFRGLENLLNCWGYFVQFGSDQNYRPSFLKASQMPLRWRFRLMEFALPTESLATYNMTSGGSLSNPNANFNKTDWFTRPLASTAIGGNSGSAVHVLAENIVALIIRPRLPETEEANISKTGGDPSLAPNYSYDSSPPAPGVTGIRYQNGLLNPVNQLPPLVQVTMVAIDEGSAIRLNLGKDSSNAFNAQNKFRLASNYDADLHLSKGTPVATDSSLEAELIRQKVSYRVFTSNVPIRAAKWSRAQTN